MMKQALGVEAEIVEGRRGEFSIWVGDTLVAQKDPDLGFPSDDEIVVAVRRAIASP